MELKEKRLLDPNAAYPLHPPREQPTTQSAASQIVDYIIAHALRVGASDIHLGLNHDPSFPDRFLLRYRIHGKLNVIRSEFLGDNYREIIARFKVLAHFVSTDTNYPQDGQIQVEFQNKRVMLRVASIPSQDFEELSIRLTKGDFAIQTVDQLLMTKEMNERLRGILQQESGMIVLNGPAGSGKTTTIYSIIRSLASPEKKIVTAEDPIEMHLPNVSHTQVTEKLDFASLSRAFMRQDADVIFIGEVRDTASAEAAIQLSQTGHLVLTTLHTRDSIGVISRLEAFNIHPNFIASSLIASLSQRLVIYLCQSCKVVYQPDTNLLDNVYRNQPEPPANLKYYKKGPGCAQCNSGIAGRIPVFELFVASPEICDQINRGATRVEVVELARQNGMKSLAEEALIRVHAGYVDIASVYGLVSSIE